MGALILGLFLGFLITAPVVFILTCWGAHSVWHCKPCRDGVPYDPAKEPTSIVERRIRKHPIVDELDSV